MTENEVREQAGREARVMYRGNVVAQDAYRVAALHYYLEGQRDERAAHVARLREATQREEIKP